MKFTFIPLLSSVLLVSLSTWANASAASAESGAVPLGNWELGGGPDLSLTLRRYEPSGSQTTFGINTSSGFHGSVAYRLTPSVQATLVPSLYQNFGSSNSPATTSLRVLFGLVYNFQPDLLGSYYVEGDIGFNTQTSVIVENAATSTTRWTHVSWAARAGKRFALTESVSYRPEVRLTFDRLGSDFSTTSLAFVPVLFSFFI